MLGMLGKRKRGRPKSGFTDAVGERGHSRSSNDGGGCRS